MMEFVMSLVPILAMITVEFTDVGLSTLTKAAINQGMSGLVLIVYYNALASLLLLPFVLFRRTDNPVTASILCRLFLIALSGSVGQILTFSALKYSSPTLLSSMAVLIVVFTFLLSVIIRMEKIEIRSKKGVAICLGSLISILGALTITLYKGPPILNISSNLQEDHSNWVFGGILMAIACFFVAIFYILTVSTMKVFPEKTTVVCSYCVFSTILCGTLTLFVERDPNLWKLNSHIQTIATVYALLAILLRNIIHTWCFHVKGPIYVTMFRPMGICIAVFMGIIFLGETLYAGSIIGGTVVTLGFYSVMWGKWKEQSVVISCGDDNYFDSNSKKAPLLHCDTI